MLVVLGIGWVITVSDCNVESSSCRILAGGGATRINGVSGGGGGEGGGIWYFRDFFFVEKLKKFQTMNDLNDNLLE